jgi:hypothetical protein
MAVKPCYMLFLFGKDMDSENDTDLVPIFEDQFPTLDEAEARISEIIERGVRPLVWQIVTMEFSPHVIS